AGFVATSKKTLARAPTDRHLGRKDATQARHRSRHLSCVHSLRVGRACTLSRRSGSDGLLARTRASHCQVRVDVSRLLPHDDSLPPARAGRTGRTPEWDAIAELSLRDQLQSAARDAGTRAVRTVRIEANRKRPASLDGVQIR